MAEIKNRKVVDETHAVPDRKGGGILKRLVWVDEKTGLVSKYSLVYVNHMIHALDNGVFSALTTTMAIIICTTWVKQRR